LRATSHDALDRDDAFHAVVRNSALTLVESVEAQRAGRLLAAGSQLKEPRPNSGCDNKSAVPQSHLDDL
jgi:hypothetical protein